MSIFVIFVIFILHLLAVSSIMTSSNSHTIFARKGRDISQRHRADTDTNHELIFAIRNNGLDEIRRLLYDVSDPLSKSYGQYLSQEDILILSDHKNSRDAVINFLEYNNFTVIDTMQDGLYITTIASLRVIERLMSAEFHHFDVMDIAVANPYTTVVRTLQYTVPSEIQDHVKYIFNMIEFPRQSILATQAHPIYDDVNKHVNSGVNKAAESGSYPTMPIGNYVTPPLLNSFYKIGSNTGSSKATQAIYASLGQHFSPSDLTMFQSANRIPLQSVQSVAGFSNASATCISIHSCDEANLDLQQIMSVSRVSPTYFMYDNTTTDFLLTFLGKICNMTRPPLVISISYSSYEAGLNQQYSQIFDFEAMKLGLQGVTILAATGDDGVAGWNARNNTNFCGYNPQWPASSPYVTAVGATQGPESGLPETACMSVNGGKITTGGGFSAVYDRPAFQKQAVADYFANLPPGQTPLWGYDTTGRGYPDISAMGFKYLVAVAGTWMHFSGTSASTPVVAGIVSLINAGRMRKRLPPLGWFNPALYSAATNASSFVNDIISGNNFCTASMCCAQGFYATKGWDPVTGFGTIDFSKFYRKFVNNSYTWTANPTPRPTPSPSTRMPVIPPTPVPSRRPTPIPSPRPTVEPSPLPSTEPTPSPSSIPTTEPSPVPSPAPTTQPTLTFSPTNPTAYPTRIPTLPPFTSLPTSAPVQITQPVLSFTFFLALSTLPFASVATGSSKQLYPQFETALRFASAKAMNVSMTAVKFDRIVSPSIGTSVANLRVSRRRAVSEQLELQSTYEDFLSDTSMRVSGGARLGGVGRMLSSQGERDYSLGLSEESEEELGGWTEATENSILRSAAGMQASAASVTLSPTPFFYDPAKVVPTPRPSPLPTPVPTRRPSPMPTMKPQTQTPTLTGACLVSMQASVPLPLSSLRGVALPLANATAVAYSSLTVALAVSVTSGAFVSSFLSSAVSQGVNVVYLTGFNVTSVRALAYTTLLPPSFMPTLAPSAVPSTKPVLPKVVKTFTLPFRAIIGLSIGGFLAVILIVMLARFYCGMSTWTTTSAFLKSRSGGACCCCCCGTPSNMCDNSKKLPTTVEYKFAKIPTDGSSSGRGDSEGGGADTPRDAPPVDLRTFRSTTTSSVFSKSSGTGSSGHSDGSGSSPGALEKNTSFNKSGSFDKSRSNSLDEAQPERVLDRNTSINKSGSFDRLKVLEKSSSLNKSGSFDKIKSDKKKSGSFDKKNDKKKSSSRNSSPVATPEAQSGSPPTPAEIQRELVSWHSLSRSQQQVQEAVADTSWTEKLFLVRPTASPPSGGSSDSYSPGGAISLGDWKQQVATSSKGRAKSPGKGSPGLSMSPNTPSTPAKKPSGGAVTAVAAVTAVSGTSGKAGTGTPSVVTPPSARLGGNTPVIRAEEPAKSIFFFM